MKANEINEDTQTNPKKASYETFDDMSNQKNELETNIPNKRILNGGPRKSNSVLVSSRA